MKVLGLLLAAILGGAILQDPRSAALSDPARAAAPSPARLVLGLYSVPAETCSLAAAAGFTIVQSYNFESASRDDSTAFVLRARAYLDAAHRYGLKVMLGLPRNWLAEHLDAPSRAAVRSLRDHPALQSWYEDEIAQQGDLEAVLFLDRVVRAEDPAHGLVIEEGVRDPHLLGIGRVRMFTYYPVTTKARASGRIKTLPERFDVKALRVPFWPALQAYGQDRVAGYPSPNLLSPNRRELQFTLYSALIAGAQGVFFYPFQHPTTYDSSKVRLKQWPYGNYQKLPDFDSDLWKLVCATADDARVLLEALQGATPVEALEAIDLPEGLEMGQWHTTQSTLLLLSNPRYQAATAVVRAPAQHGAVRYLLEGRFTGAQTSSGPDLRLEVPGPGGVAVLVESQ